MSQMSWAAGSIEALSPSSSTTVSPAIDRTTSARSPAMMKPMAHAAQRLAAAAAGKVHGQREQQQRKDGDRKRALVEQVGGGLDRAQLIRAHDHELGGVRRSSRALPAEADLLGHLDEQPS